MRGQALVEDKVSQGATKQSTGSCWRGLKPSLTELVWEPQVVSEEVGHVVVQPFQHVQGIVNEEDSVVIPIQQPLEVVIPMKMGRQKGGHPSPASPPHKGQGLPSEVRLAHQTDRTIDSLLKCDEFADLVGSLLRR